MQFVDFMRQNWGWILSFSTVLLGGFGYLFGQLRALKRGVQAMLRAQMIAEFNRWEEKGWAPVYAKDNFENLWQQYEKLGKNGVMANIRTRFLALPNHYPTQSP
ncbi:MAG: hypothetical protein IKN04_12215 [Clostridia bacterium]|nr:hypothetical protein [Clostridia bacterium]